jgi:ABC-type antimicrobial peptide transport system permease subunit
MSHTLRLDLREATRQIRRNAGMSLLIVTILAAAAAGRVIQSRLFDTDARSAGILTAVAIGIVIVTVLATLIPARRAACISPLDALRSE